MNMSQDLKIDLLPKLRARYQQRNCEGKTRMLDALSEDYGYERKYAIELLRDTVPAPNGRHLPSDYTRTLAPEHHEVRWARWSIRCGRNCWCRAKAARPADMHRSNSAM